MLEISEAGKHAADQLKQLEAKEAKEFGGGEEPHNSVAVTILKILTIIGGIFFAMLFATSLPPEMAFISITLIAITVAALVTGAEKIVAIFPRRLCVWRSYTPPPSSYDYYPAYDSYPPSSRWSLFNPRSWGSGTFSRGGHSVYSGRGGHSGEHTVYSGRGGHGSGHSASGGSPSPSTTGGHAARGGGHSGSRGGNPTTGGHAARGGGHHGSPYAGGTPGNVAVGSQRHDPKATTPRGNVVPGSGRGRR